MQATFQGIVDGQIDLINSRNRHLLTVNWAEVQIENRKKTFSMARGSKNQKFYFRLTITRLKPCERKHFNIKGFLHLQILDQEGEFRISTHLVNSDEMITALQEQVALAHARAAAHA